MRYTALDGPNPLPSSLLAMLTVRSAAEMDEAMRDWIDPCNNFVFADVDGEVRYLNRGRVPVRPEANYWLPVPGWSGDHEWDGFIAHEDLPRIVNPPDGRIVTANQKIVGPEFPAPPLARLRTRVPGAQDLRPAHRHGHGRPRGGRLCPRRARVRPGHGLLPAAYRGTRAGRAFRQGAGDAHRVGLLDGPRPARAHHLLGDAAVP